MKRELLEDMNRSLSVKVEGLERRLRDAVFDGEEGKDRLLRDGTAFKKEMVTERV